ncbi:MAG: alpha/beta hydrolase [Proteobacteria bacterium]|nr:alpha/beta hydrolase [Pseudomonadota bacterium]
MPHATVNGARLWYQESGAGPTVLNLHGSGFGHKNFAQATPRLAAHFRVIDFDMRGHGASDRPLQDYSMAVWADDAAALLEALEVRRAHIHGTSMGGAVAIQFAASYPERTDRLVLNCATAKQDFAARLATRGWIETARAFGPGSRELAETIAFQCVSRAFLSGPNGGDTFVDGMAKMLGEANTAEIFVAACEAISTMDLRPLLSRIEAPTLVIGGDEDIRTPWVAGADGAGQDFIARTVPGARRYVIKGAAHSTLLEAPDENCNVVIDFLKGKDVGSPG